jgi:hypothetical protein
MNVSHWTRIRGGMLLAGAVAGVIVMAIHPDDIRDPRNGPLHTVYFFTSLLVVLGLAGATDRLRGRAGVAAGVGFTALSGFFAISEMGHSVLDATIVPLLRDNLATTELVTDDSWLAQSLFSGTFGTMLMLGMVLLLAGLLLVSIGTLIEGSYPRWPAVLLLLVSPTPLLPFTQGPIGPALMYLALAGFGYAMLTGAGPEPLPFRLPRRSARRAPLAS